MKVEGESQGEMEVSLVEAGVIQGKASRLQTEANLFSIEAAYATYKKHCYHVHTQPQR